MTKLTENVFAVEVPEGLVQPWYQTERSISAIIEGRVEDEELVIRHIERKCGSPTGKITIKIPAGNWQFICTTREATAEQAASIVQIISSGKITGTPQYRRYDRDPVKDTPAKCWTRDPRHSLETLLTTKGLDPNKNYPLLKKG